MFIPLAEGPFAGSDGTSALWWLPDFIPRIFALPIIPTVDSKTIMQLDTSFAGLSLTELRLALRENKDRYVNGLRCILPEAHVVDVRARIITLTQNPSASQPFVRPDHAFILEGSGFFPFHATIMAAYCGRFPSQLLPPFPQSASLSSPLHFNIRFVRLRFANEMVMACFREWVYRQDDSLLRPVLLPHSPTHPSTLSFETLKEDWSARTDLSRNLAATCGERQLWEYVSNVLDCRRLMTTLGVDDRRVWTAMTVAWDILLTALNAACAAEAAKDESRGIDTSAIRTLLKSGLGMFEGQEPAPDLTRPSYSAA